MINSLLCMYNRYSEVLLSVCIFAAQTSYTRQEQNGCQIKGDLTDFIVMYCY